METIDYLVISITAFVYGMTFIYQHRKFESLKTILKNQNDFVSNYEKYKLLLNDTFDLRMEKQKTELEASFNKQIIQVANQTMLTSVKVFQQESQKLLKGWDELSQIAVSIILKKYPDKADKKNRDEYIKKYYPHNTEYFIGFIDAYLNDEIKMEPPTS